MPSKRASQEFSHADWRRHRSIYRHLHHLLTAPASGIAKGIFRPVMCVVVLSTLIAAYSHSFAIHCLPHGLPAPPSIAMQPVQLSSFALSLLLVFRTNVSYARWLDARRAFGTISTSSQDLARQVCVPSTTAHLPVADLPWLIAVAKCSMVHLRDTGCHDLRTELTNVLQPHELDMLCQAGNKPIFCLQMISRIIATSGLDHVLVVHMDERVTKLYEAFTGCERILNTPIPLSYTRHTARCLLVWLACLPFSMWGYCGWAMIPIAALVACVLLGIEEIGVYIEEPFSILALEALCSRQQRTIDTMLTEQAFLDQLDAQEPQRQAAASQQQQPADPVLSYPACMA
ncbi:MAG: hypothetical protein WDW38_009804 [Sanguina aurantia]